MHACWEGSPAGHSLACQSDGCTAALACCPTVQCRASHVSSDSVLCSFSLMASCLQGSLKALSIALERTLFGSDAVLNAFAVVLCHWGSHCQGQLPELVCLAPAHRTPCSWVEVQVLTAATLKGCLKACWNRPSALPAFDCFGFFTIWASL